MVRETRHLWVGNLPDNIREDRIREHFKRYGRVQNVKLLGRTESPCASTTPGAPAGVSATGGCATVAFMDIKSASKAHNVEHVLDERTLTTEYYEPAAIPSAAGAPSAGSSPAGSGYSGSSSSVNSAPTPASTSRYHLSGEENVTGTCPLAASAAAPAAWRGTNDSATDFCRRGSTPAAYSRYPRNTNAPYSTPPNNTDRTPHHRWYAGGGSESAPSTPGGAAESGPRRRRSGSGSHSSSCSSDQDSSDSRASTPAAPPPNATPVAQWSATACGRPLAICVRNLPTRSTDSSLKDGLYHEYKKHGKVMWVQVVGQNADRYAVVRFKKPSDVEKAIEVSQDKQFFGCKITVMPHQSCDEDAESAKPFETDIDEYHPKATRTLFIGNLEKDVTQQQLREKFKRFGRIIEIDIKKGGGGPGPGYAFCQFASISSVVDAIKAMDGENIGSSRVKLGFGKPVATTCVWIDGLTEANEKQVLGAVSRCGTAKSVCVDRASGAALVHFEQAAAASNAVRDLRRYAASADSDQRRLMVDYASRECQESFYEHLEKQGSTAAPPPIGTNLTSRYMPPSKLDMMRYAHETSGRGRSQNYGRNRPIRYPETVEYQDRRFRAFEDIEGGSPVEEPPYEERLQSVVMSPCRQRKHRRESTPEDLKHPKERHRSNGTRRCSGDMRHRSRSGSRSEHRRRGGHRRRREESGSRAGTPLCDELPDGPAEPRRPPQPRDRSHLPMSLPLPKFAAELLRAAHPHGPPPLPAPAPASPSRPPSASSSSGGSAPHSPSLEERIRSLDEKYEKWSGSRSSASEAAERGRFRHRLLEVDINEVRPSDVVKSLLAKRSVFDEDSERLEGASSQRPPSPEGSPQPSVASRALQYSFPPHSSSSIATSSEGSSDAERVPPNGVATKSGRDNETDSINSDTKILDNLLDNSIDTDNRTITRTKSALDSVCIVSDPRRTDKSLNSEKFSKSSESDSSVELGLHIKSSSIDKQPDIERKFQDQKGHQDRSQELRRRIEGMEKDNKSKNDEGNKVVKNSSVENVKFLNHTQDNNESTQFIIKDLQNKTSEKHDNRQKCSESESGRKFLFDRTKLGDPEIPLNLFEESTLKSEIFQNSEVKEQSSIKIDKTEKSNQTGIHRKNHNELEKSENKIIEEKKEEINVLENNRKTSKTYDCVNTINDDKNNDPVNIVYEKSVSSKLQREESDTEKSHKIIKTDNRKNLKCNFLEEQTLFGKLLTLNEKKSKNDKIEFDRLKANKEKNEKEKHESPKLEKTRKHDKDKSEKDRRNKDDLERKHSEKTDRNKKESDKDDVERKHLDKTDRSKKDSDKSDKECAKYDSDKISKEDKKHSDTKSHDHKKDRERRKEDLESQKHSKKEDKHKHDRHRKEYSETKRDSKKDHDVKSKKISKDESNRDLCRKDSTDSSASRTSHDSSKNKELDTHETKDDNKSKVPKHIEQHSHKHRSEKETLKMPDISKVEDSPKGKSDTKDDKDLFSNKPKHDNLDNKSKVEPSDKPRHYSVDSPSLESKRKDRLNSCSSLPSNIGHKRRMSSHDSVDSLIHDNKKSKQDIKVPERRESKDSKHKISKFSKGHFAKLIESKTKEEKKNQVKTPDDSHRSEWQDSESKDFKFSEKCKITKKSSKDFSDEKSFTSPESSKSDGLQSHLDFLATLELRSSEEDEKQKAFRNEMKEKKRIQQLQQIQELQKQKDAFNHTDILIRKDDKKLKSEDKKKDISREKRLSTDRKSRDEKPENRRKSRKQIHSSDTSDTDEPKKHSIFDIVDDGPTYISMYDKVKARSCKNMQKQEEEKRQEKIKAKFSQLKQSRAKREEKKRSSWDEDSDSEYDRKKSLSKHNSRSSDEEQQHSSKGEDAIHSSLYNDLKIEDYDDTSNNEEDSKNKLCRKNSRSRILSDTSDDENDNMNSLNTMKDDASCRKQRAREFFTKHIKDKVEPEYLTHGKLNSSICDIKSDNDDREIKRDPSSERDEYKSAYLKTNTTLDSSENESSYNRYLEESRRKHKKKQKKERPSLSGDELKSELNNSLEIKHRHDTDKTRKHSNKKEKRKDKIRNSVDIEDMKDEKIKNKKVHPNHNRDHNQIINHHRIENHIKKDGKMEDIFGPLSDESDTYYENEYPNHNYGINLHHSKDQFDINSETTKLKEKEDMKRKKDKKRKEKRHMFKEDDNSLDVDAVGKAIEERLCADSVSDENVINARLYEYRLKNDDDKYFDNATDMIFSNKHSERHKKDKEKRKKKKRNKDERQKHHHNHHHDKVDKLELPMPDLLQNTNINKIHSPIDKDDISTSIDNHSLPRLIESPPASHKYVDIINEVSISSNILKDSDTMLKINDDKIDRNISEVIVVDTPSVIVDVDSDKSLSSPCPKFTNCDPDIEHTSNDNAVRSISSSQDDIYVETPVSIVEDKTEEKPRAMISQEETADAVAALLGESFGGSGNSFDSYTEPSEQTPENIGTTSISTENIPEEDAEEMRQAVQNLNASEMELKPGTPMSDNDLLLIDTDNEECEEAASDVIDKVPINIITTGNAPVNTCINNSKGDNIITKPKPIISSPNVINVDEGKSEHSGNKVSIGRQENPQQITSTATTVITSWTTTNKLRDCQTNVMTELSKDNAIKSPKITTDIEHIMTSHAIVVNKNHQRGRVEDITNTTTIRASAPYTLVNQMSRSTQATNMQPPTIKIPESNIYQKQQGIVISPRMASEVRLQSPKTSPQADGITSPRLTILSTSQQAAGLPSPTNLQQRSPSQVTLVRMQQPPLSPIQNMHIPHTTRTLVSPNRPNSVLVQTQAPGHFNRLPVTSGLAPLTKQINTGNILSQNKTVPNSTIIHQVVSGDTRKMEHRDNNETSKIILSPTRLQQSTNPTVMAQNRLLARQNAVHLGNMNAGLHLSNKVLINHLSDKRENANTNFKAETPKLDQSVFGHAPTIQVNHSAASIIQSNIKHEQYTNRHHLPNVIQTLNSQRLLTTVPMTNVIQIDSNRNQALLSTIRHPTVLTKVDSPKNVALTTGSMTNVVTTPLIFKSSSTNAVRPTDNNDIKSPNIKAVTDVENRLDASKPAATFDTIDRRKELYIKPYTPISKCETDFEELLKDNTNEIKVTNNPDKGLEIHVGKSISNFMNENRREMTGDKCLKNEEKMSLSSADLSIPENGIKLESEIKEEPTEFELTPEEHKESVKVEETQSVNVDADVQLKNSVNSSEHVIEESSKSSANIVNENRKSEESDNWSAKDVNIESVIKKVDSLCNDLTVENNDEITNSSENKTEDVSNNDENCEMINNDESQEEENSNIFDENSSEKSNVSKRGGRAVRGRRSDKNLDRIQTRHISKAARRGNPASKRGRGRGKAEKKTKNTANVCPNNLPGDVYDFHEDSGDESSSQNKSDRPRLILTIKSPVMINANATPTSTLSIASPFISRDEKAEDFLSPSSNTRKSRRLQEKDVHRNTTEDLDDTGKPLKPGKDSNKKRPTRQAMKTIYQDKSPVGTDVRKSPRGVKRTKNRSLSDASIDSSDEKTLKKEETSRDAKIAKLSENIQPELPKDDVEPVQTPVPKPVVVTVAPAVIPTPAPAVIPDPALTVTPSPTPAVIPTHKPIMKPPKKMISEISAKLGTAIFESTASQPMMRSTISPNIPEKAADDPFNRPLDLDKQRFRDYREGRNIECANTGPEEILSAATAESHVSDMAFPRRIVDNVPVNMMPVGATEATDARVQSPALPHRPPSAHLATPVLIRGSEGGACAPRDALLYRIPYGGTASLPRGAHHPPPLPPHLKQVAIVGPHHQHPHQGSTARVTITSVPSGSPQGQVGSSCDTSDLARIPPPAHQQTSPITPGDGIYHFSHQHYQMYQQHFRATQHESRNTTPPFTRMEAEGSEAPMPPLELRRPPGARVPRPAHSPSPADRFIRCRSPPPAHAGVGVPRMPSALPPPAAPGPPHASQVPREADSLQTLLRRYPVMWQGLLALKNDSAAVQMHFVHGNAAVAANTLPRHMDGSTPPLRITQRMRLEPSQLDQVTRKMQLENEHCMLLALPCGRDHMDVLQQSTNLTGGFITYLRRKQAAGIFNVGPPGQLLPTFTVHIFPSCDFANENLNRIAPDLMHRVTDIAHLLIVIATV